MPTKRANYENDARRAAEDMTSEEYARTQKRMICYVLASEYADNEEIYSTAICQENFQWDRTQKRTIYLFRMSTNALSVWGQLNFYAWVTD